MLAALTWCSSRGSVGTNIGVYHTHTTPKGANYEVRVPRSLHAEELHVSSLEQELSFLTATVKDPQDVEPPVTTMSSFPKESEREPHEAAGAQIKHEPGVEESMELSPVALAQDSLLEPPSPPINSFTTRRCRTATPRRGRGSAMSLEKYWGEGENGDLPGVLLRPSSAEPAAKKQRGAQRNSHSGSVKEDIQDMWEKLSLQEMLHSYAPCTLHAIHTSWDAGQYLFFRPCGNDQYLEQIYHIFVYARGYFHKSRQWFSVHHFSLQQYHAK